MLDLEELQELEDNIKKELNDHLTGILTLLNRTDRLEELLILLGMEELLKQESNYESYRTGKIVVIGQSDVKKDHLLAIGKSFGIDKNRFELFLDYEDAKTFDFKKIQWQPTYSLIMVGPMPHSIAGKGNYSSIISALESESGYPPVVRLGKNSLKITKSDFKEKLKEAIDQQKII